MHRSATALAGLALATILSGVGAPSAHAVFPTATTTETAATAATARAQSHESCRRTLPRYPKVRPGERSRAVRVLQCVINDTSLGPIAVDGWYGPQTRGAIRRLWGAFEGRPHHPYVVKHWYWTILFAVGHRMQGLHLGDRGVRVRSLQRALRADGWSIVVDGYFGPQTKARVRAFQRSCELTPASGRVNGDTAFNLAMGGCGT
jgi:peptidoglycan hydrolase-like protein with peptidoglycan-binding domain